MDRNLGKKLASLLAAQGCRVEIHDDHFAQDTEDVDWLKAVGARKWVVVSKDRHIAQNKVEVVRLLESGSPAFVFTVADMTSEEMSGAFVKALPSIKRCLSKFDWPFIATITATGRVQILITVSGLIKRV